MVDIKKPWQFEHSVDCKAAKSFVWQYWTDVSNWERLEGEAVEWIRIEGPFAEGTSGATKIPGQEPHYWRISQLQAEFSATIEIQLDGALFLNKMTMKSISLDATRITQCLSLVGEKASNYAEGMKTFETSAPQGLVKLANAIETTFGSV
ncbi:MAG: hypothetical protein F6J90_42480 [Moorea sp. SIOASIH]|uniref:hypothetical protein n=1 Tax=Moorena sp. SIOASIH TaxID=2607817 RepID=UPI0013B69ED0|nr:hypothetical protein [Moorena sp. SIOASIH]NEO42632.1 hypothetical protein [Moorena sp. SIOASIH]